MKRDTLRGKSVQKIDQFITMIQTCPYFFSNYEWADSVSWVVMVAWRNRYQLNSHRRSEKTKKHTRRVTTLALSLNKKIRIITVVQLCEESFCHTLLYNVSQKKSALLI